MTTRTRMDFLSCPFDDVSADEAVAQILSWCATRSPPRTVMTMNAALLVQMEDHVALASACRAGDLIIPDGVPVVWAARWLGVKLRERIAGVDLMGRLLREAHQRRLRVFFLGATPDVLRSLLERCAQDYPDLQVAGAHHGYFTDAHESALVAQIRQSRADLLFIGMPSPFKEVWAEKQRAHLGVPVIMGVGGSFDVLSGHIRRAPAWLQQMGLEWGWRLAREPRRLWRRYLLTNTRFLTHFARAWLGRFSGAALGRHAMPDANEWAGAAPENASVDIARAGSPGARP